MAHQTRQQMLETAIKAIFNSYGAIDEINRLEQSSDVDNVNVVKKMKLEIKNTLLDANVCLWNGEVFEHAGKLYKINASPDFARILEIKSTKTNLPSGMNLVYNDFN